MRTRVVLLRVAGIRYEAVLLDLAFLVLVVDDETLIAVENLLGDVGFALCKKCKLIC